MNARKAISTLYIAREQAVKEASEYLKSVGWEFSSNYPGSIWLWRKTFAENFHVSGATLDTALTIENGWQSGWRP